MFHYSQFMQSPVLRLWYISKENSVIITNRSLIKLKTTTRTSTLQGGKNKNCTMQVNGFKSARSEVLK